MGRERSIINNLLLFKPSAKRKGTDRQRIFDWFVKPLIKYLASESESTNWELYVEHIFCTESRRIRLAKARVRFKMPGVYCLIPDKPIAGYGERDIKANEPFFVRIDYVDKIYDIQLAKDEKEWFYRLTEEQYKVIEPHLIFLD